MAQGKPTFPNADIRQLGVVYVLDGEASSKRIDEVLECLDDNQHPVTLRRSRARLVRLGGLATSPLHEGSAGRPRHLYSITNLGTDIYLASLMNGQNNLGFHLRLENAVNGGNWQDAHERTTVIAHQLLELDLYKAMLE